jgi:uncharacterized protein (UPF0297 family)
MNNSLNETRKLTNLKEQLAKHGVIADRDTMTPVGKVLADVYQALTEKGYNPVNQIVGYILSDEPTYITSYKDARKKISRLERDEILEELVNFYINNNF